MDLLSYVHKVKKVTYKLFVLILISIRQNGLEKLSSKYLTLENGFSFEKYKSVFLECTSYVIQNLKNLKIIWALSIFKNFKNCGLTTFVLNEKLRAVTRFVNTFV